MKQDLTKMTDAQLFQLKETYMETYKWLAHFEGDDGDSEMYYFENISPIDDELKARGLL